MLAGMPSRLETLLSDLMVAKIESRDSFCIEADALEDLLAVVEAARKLSDSSSLSHVSPDVCTSTVRTDYCDELDAALAKLDAGA